MTPRWRAWGAALAWAALIFLLSSRPTIPVDLEWGTDKIAHFAAYLVLGVLLARARGTHPVQLAQAALLGLAYGLSDEVHQHFVPGRTADFGDWTADALGTIAGVSLWARRSP